MAIFEWRKFNFFDLKSNDDENKVSDALKDAKITCSTNGNSQIILCDSLGFVHVFKRSWDSITFKAHDDSICLCELSRMHNLLITVGGVDDELNGMVPTFKIWNLTKITKNMGLSSSLVRTVKIAIQKPTALAISDNGQFMAIGFDSGSISLYRGDISRDRSKTLKTLSGNPSPTAAPTHAHGVTTASSSSSSSSITGIAFNQIGSKSVQMFVCSDSGVIVYHLQQNNDKEPKITLDSLQVPTRCCAMQINSIHHESSHFMIGRDDAVYCYTADGRGPCYALDGQKSIIQWYRSQLITISKSNKQQQQQQITTASSNATTHTPSSSIQKNSILTVIDIQNKFIVFQTQMEQTVIAIIIEFGHCFLITENKQVYYLDEKDLPSKLCLLFKKNLYDIAVRIAKSNQYDKEDLAEIFKQYGDHMYGKGDYAAAVEQYEKTIGYLAPSYVIRRFLDSRHIHYLTDYLQALHKQGQATADHTTLLLNCFTRLDHTDELKAFLGNDKNPDIQFDLDVAIKVCRATSVEHALALAKRNQKYDLCLSILIEDMHEYLAALEYIQNHLPFHDAEANLKKYGTRLMEMCPDAVTELLKKLCTNYSKKSTDTTTTTTNESIMSNVQSGNNTNINNDIIFSMINTGVTDEDIERANPEDFLHLFVKSSERLIDFLEHLIANVTNCSQLVYNTLIEHYLYRWSIDKRIELRLMEILQNTDEIYDRNHALILCSTYGFTPGIMLIYEEQKLYHLIVRYHLRNGNYNSLLECCKRLGKDQPSLWLQALTGLRNDKIAPTNLLTQILQVISNEKLQSPLQVLNCLAVENGPDLLNVREYFSNVFQKEKESTKQEEELVTKYRNDSVALKMHIQNLLEKPIEFKGTLCNTCQKPLNMPAIYFLCKHSYHQDCIRGYSENDKDCPVCHTKNVQLIDALRAQSESRDQHEQFHNLLDRSIEPFSVVAEYFGRGLFNKIVIIDEDAEMPSSSSSTFNDDKQSTERYQSKLMPQTNQFTNQQQQQPQPQQYQMQTNRNNYSDKYGSAPFGPGAEAKLRLEEGKISGGGSGGTGSTVNRNQMTKENNQISSAIKRIPIPEGRMRLNESKYSSSLEANIIRSNVPLSSSVTSGDVAAGGNRNSPSSSWIKVHDSPKSARSKNKFASTERITTTNPFGDDDDDGDDVGIVAADDNGNGNGDKIVYDESKNPFADEFADDDKKYRKRKQLDEYDDSINPFA